MFITLTNKAFLIRRFSVELQVELHVGGMVKIEPYRCKADNKRLWSGIAKTQTVFAQMQLDQNRQSPPFALLLSLFQHEGWEVDIVTEGENENKMVLNN